MFAGCRSGGSSSSGLRSFLLGFGSRLPLTLQLLHLRNLAFHLLEPYPELLYQTASHPDVCHEPRIFEGVVVWYTCCDGLVLRGRQLEDGRVRRGRGR